MESNNTMSWYGWYVVSYANSRCAAKLCVGDGKSAGSRFFPAYLLCGDFVMCMPSGLTLSQEPVSVRSFTEVESPDEFRVYAEKIARVVDCAPPIPMSLMSALLRKSSP